MSDTLGIQVRIETQADVAAVEKATGSIDKLDQVTKELGGDMDRLRAKLNEAEAAIKGTGEAGTTAGTNLGKGMTEGAGLARTALGNILPATNVNDLIQGAWSIGTQIGSKLGEAIELSTQGRLDWDHLFGDGAEMDASAMRNREAIKSVQDAHRALVDQINNPPGSAFTDAMKGIEKVAREAAEAMAELKKTMSLANKVEDSQDKEIDTQRKEAIDASDMSEGEKIRAKADIDNEAATREQVKRDERRQQEIDNAGIEAQALERDAKAKALQVAEASKRTETALDIDKQVGAINTDDEAYRDRIRQKKGREAGFDDLGTPQQEAAREKQARAAEEAAAEKAAAARRKLGGAIERGGIESDLDKQETEAANQRRSAGADKQAGSKEAADAGKAAKDAAKSVDGGTKEMAKGLKELAEMVKGKDSRMADAITKMAEGLKDGASQEELAKIQAAMDVVGKSQNEAFATLGKTIDSMASAVETSAKTAQDALRRAEALERKVSAMKR